MQLYSNKPVPPTLPKNNNNDDDDDNDNKSSSPQQVRYGYDSTRHQIMASGNPLSPRSLARIMAASLPGDATAGVKNEYEAVALLSHACMVAVGFRLVGLGEEDEDRATVTTRAGGGSDGDSGRGQEGALLPASWNENSSSYAFRYRHDQSAMTYLLKTTRLGSKAVVLGMGVGDDKPVSFGVPVREFLDRGRFPVVGGEGMEERIREVFGGEEGKMGELVGGFKKAVIQRLVPGLRKEGYEEERGGSSSTAAAAAAATGSPPGRHPQPPPRAGQPDDPLRDESLLPAPARPHPFEDPLLDHPRHRPVPAGDFPPPGFEDEYEIGRPPRGYAPGFGGNHPLGIGERDLYPPGLGPRDPFGGVGGRTGGGGGMHPTFDDPLFGGRGGRQEYDPR
ncbi:hypothetical protein FGG08_003568 [Glutinoglossum americanum]|uniref:Proteasome inhibitor PI31 subunit n=1 Tax=Glutinoglossum americanum TaxID=1670608 RepID=A0A9P8KXZ9_9PEZI|nr:hypothetical protein FGG08_003568 [Glutinoglossum americanum]